MSPSPLAIPPLLLVTTLAVRLAARVLSRTTVEWNHCFGFGILLVLATWALTAWAPLFLPSLSFPVALASITLPFVALGAWYFSTRAITDEGKQGGWLNGLNITAGTVLCSVLVVIPLLKLAERLLQGMA